MVDRPAEQTPAEFWLPSPPVWIKSERLDLHDWLGAIVSLRGAS
jgi:hypothetical protein